MTGELQQSTLNTTMNSAGDLFSEVRNAGGLEYAMLVMGLIEY